MMFLFGPIGPTELLIVLPIALLFASIGLTVIASGQVFLAIRETALNTRKEESDEKAEYKILFTVARLNNLVGWLIIIFGVIGAFAITALISR